jgi:bifunctional UDP-N-acetylglucosamine pyrophosphorylase/glucosamine-1-phosphate N-acetyltransferase
MTAISRLQVLDRDDALPLLAPDIASEDWSAIIPAAGRGSRLKSEAPKILFPLAGRPVLDHLMELLAGLCSRVVLVVSPDRQRQVQPHLSRFSERRMTTASQKRPLGMADAVRCGLPQVVTPHTLVIWGDQAGIQRSSVEISMRLHSGPIAPAATLPTVLRENPYIHFQRNAGGQIVDALQAREGDQMPLVGESDCGLFLFQTAVLKRFMPMLMGSAQCIGRQTGELNFLPILPMIASTGERVVSARIASAEESLGLNTREDAARLSQTFTRFRSAGS